jgi:DNA (cytosine-5)-methyltransferase 1
LLQTFPADYDFYDEWEDIGVKNLGRLIGNAVPPKLGEYVGRAIRESFGEEISPVESHADD